VQFPSWFAFSLSLSLTLSHSLSPPPPPALSPLSPFLILFTFYLSLSLGDSRRVLSSTSFPVSPFLSLIHVPLSPIRFVFGTRHCLTYLNKARPRHCEYRESFSYPIPMHRDSPLARLETDKRATTLVDSSVVALIDRPPSRPTAPTLHSVREEYAGRNSFNLSDAWSAPFARMMHAREIRIRSDSRSARPEEELIGGERERHEHLFANADVMMDNILDSSAEANKFSIVRNPGSGCLIF